MKSDRLAIPALFARDRQWIFEDRGDVQIV